MNILSLNLPVAATTNTHPCYAHFWHSNWIWMMGGNKHNEQIINISLELHMFFLLLLLLCCSHHVNPHANSIELTATCIQMLFRSEKEWMQSCNTKTEPDFLDHRFPMNPVHTAEKMIFFSRYYQRKKKSELGNQFDSFVHKLFDYNVSKIVILIMEFRMRQVRLGALTKAFWLMLLMFEWQHCGFCWIDPVK